MEDDDFLELILDKYADDANRDINTIPAAYRPIMCVLIAHYPILNGGYRFLFENDFTGNLELSEVIESYEKIGFNDISSSIKGLLHLFPENCLPKNIDKRDSYLTKYFDEEIYDEQNYSEIPNRSYSTLVGEAESLYYRQKNNIVQSLRAQYEQGSIMVRHRER